MARRVHALCATTISPKNRVSGRSKLRGNEATVCTTGTRRMRDSTRPAPLVRAFGANTKCQTLAREPRRSQPAARKFADSAGVNAPGAPYAGTMRTERAPGAEIKVGAPGIDSTTGSTRVRWLATSRTRHL